MSGWRRCDSCRKVKQTSDFEGAASTCQSCLTAPAPKPRARTSAVTRSTTAPRPPAAPSDRGPRLGSVGSGDLEVRERRAKRAAHDGLAEMHPHDFAQLLRTARAAEGLRPLGADGGPAAPDGT